MSTIEMKKKAINSSINAQMKALSNNITLNKDHGPALKNLLGDGNVDEILRYLNSDKVTLTPKGHNRFSNAIQMWSHKPIHTKIEVNSQEETFKDGCLGGETYRIIPMIEEYRGTVFDSIVQEKALILKEERPNHNLSKVCTIFSIPNKLTLTYIELKGTSFFKKIFGTFPYAVAPTLEESFKLMLEWQWAYKYCENTEPVARICNEFLLAVGLDVDDQDTNPVVRSLMALPDMYVAQYLKGDDIYTSPQAPEPPLEFLLWACEKGMFTYKRNSGNDIYETCLKIKILQKKLLEI